MEAIWWRMVVVEFGRRRGREGKARVEIRGAVRGPVWFVRYSVWAARRVGPVRLAVVKRVGEVSMGFSSC